MVLEYRLQILTPLLMVFLICIYISNRAVSKVNYISGPLCGLGGLMVSALDCQVGYHGSETPSGRDNFQTISMSSSYSTCPGLSIRGGTW